ncbi:MAG TPA: pilin [Gammaproteobacteria bacterium]
MNKTQQGFTLIELMIVVAILGFLITIALPAYQAYTARAKISEILVVADAAKSSLSDYYMSAGQMPSSTTQANINTNIAQSSFINAISFTTTATTATISYTVQNTGATGDIALVGTASANGIQWSCNTAATTVDNKYLPISCRN